MNMANITLDEKELREAVVLKLSDMGLSIDDPKISDKIEFTAGRGKNGFSASVSIGASSMDTSEQNVEPNDETNEGSFPAEPEAQEPPKEQESVLEESVEEPLPKEDTDSVFGGKGD